jgi:hypothetical protein
VASAAPTAPQVAFGGSLGESETGETTVNLTQGRLLIDGVPMDWGGGRGIAATRGTFQQAAAARVEDVYEFTFPFAVRLGSRQSALLPFLQRTLPIEKLSIFNASTDRGNPRLGARLENTADIPLEAGPVTFFHDSRYAGEAVLDYLPRGEHALVSFGVDHEIQIASTQQAKPENTVRLTISKGVAVLFTESLRTTTYEIRNRGLEPRTLVIEHSRGANRELSGAKPYESTDNFHRFRLALDPQAETVLPVAEVVSRQTTVSLQQMTRPQLSLFDNSATPQRIRERLGDIVETQERLSAMRADVQQLQAGIDSWFKDQERLRENLKALGDGAEDQQLRSRYLQQLQSQEDQIDASRARIDAVTKEMATTEARLNDLISTFTFGA